MMKAGVCSVLLLFSIFLFFFFFLVKKTQNFLERFAAGSRGLGFAGGVNSCMGLKLV